MRRPAHTLLQVRGGPAPPAPGTRPRALTAAELARALEQGRRSAWQLEGALADAYARHIDQAYRLAAKALPRIAKHSPAGGLAAAGMDPAERAQRQLATTRRTKAAAKRAGRSGPGTGGWSVPDQDELGVALRARMDAEWEKKKAGDAPQAIRLEAMRRATKAGLDLMHISFDVRNPLVEGVLQQLGGKITEIEATTRRDIMASLDQSWQKGDSIPKAAAKLRATSSQVSLARGRLIARTEILGAVNGGAHALGALSDQIGRETGQPPLLKIWLTAEDEAVRDSHVAAGDDYSNGNGIPMDEPFQVGGSLMQYPGDPDGSAEEVCNCRCALSYEEGEPTAAPEPPAPEPSEPDPAQSDLGLADPAALEAERARYASEDAAANAAQQAQWAAEEKQAAQDAADEDAARRAAIAYDPGRAAAEHAKLPPRADLIEPDTFGVTVTASTPAWDAARLEAMFRSQAIVDNGLRVTVRSVARDQAGQRIRVSAVIKHESGAEVGTVERTIDLRAKQGMGAGVKLATHDSFFLSDEVQGKGIAKDFLRAAIKQYDDAGITRVEVHAAGENGRYTWARFGFDFQQTRSIDLMRSSFRQQLAWHIPADAAKTVIDERTGIERVLNHDEVLNAAFPETTQLIDGLRHSWEFAGLLIRENGVELTGKEFMLNGPTWHGQLNLSPASPGRQVFDAYVSKKH